MQFLPPQCLQHSGRHRQACMESPGFSAPPIPWDLVLSSRDIQSSLQCLISQQSLAASAFSRLWLDSGMTFNYACCDFITQVQPNQTPDTLLSSSEKVSHYRAYDLASPGAMLRSQVIHLVNVGEFIPPRSEFDQLKEMERCQQTYPHPSNKLSEGPVVPHGLPGRPSM